MLHCYFKTYDHNISVNDANEHIKIHNFLLTAPKILILGSKDRALEGALESSWARWVETSEFPLLYFRVVPGQDVLNSKILSRVRWLHCQARLVVARWSPFGVPPAAQTSSLVAVGFHPVLLQL